jgi:hypothetical protein
MTRTFRTPVLALIVALSTLSLASSPTQATAQNSFVVGKTYQTSSGGLVTFAGNDRNGQPIFERVERRKPVTKFHFNTGHRNFARHRSFSRHHGFSRNRAFAGRHHFGGHRGRLHRRH